MAQDYQMIGRSPRELEAQIADPPGWQGEIPEPLNVEQTEHNFSFRHQRSKPRPSTPSCPTWPATTTNHPWQDARSTLSPGWYRPW